MRLRSTDWLGIIIVAAILVFLILAKFGVYPPHTTAVAP
jgi:hypothetical protein